jgi:hypothetical protein
MCPVTDDDRRDLVLAAGWSGRWVTTWKVAGREVICPVAGMGGFPVSGCGPVRHFTWRTGQGHRPGLQSMTGTGRLHGFESHAEQRLLLALDFLGVHEVVSQPHRMRFESAAGPRDGARRRSPVVLSEFPHLVDGQTIWLAADFH